MRIFVDDCALRNGAGILVHMEPQVTIEVTTKDRLDMEKVAAIEREAEAVFAKLNDAIVREDPNGDSPKKLIEDPELTAKSF